MYIQEHNELGYICTQWPIQPELPTLILIHGAGLNHAQWQAQLEGLRDSANVIALDLPGHSLSAHHEGEQSIAAYSQNIVELMEALALKQAILVGHSMGGAVCLEFATRYPERAQALVLLNTGAKLKVQPALLEQIRDNYPAYVDMMVQNTLTDGAAPEIVEPFADLLHQGDIESVVRDFEACNAFDRLDVLAEIQCPALVLSAELDQMTPPKYGQYLADQLDNSQFVVVEGAAHLSPMEHPDEVNQAITDFIDQLSRTYTRQTATA
ncbi:Pimeloyl-ACP methyl ester carboxylesterase [Oceanospirillum multiglobuliferum]|uniref:AB hydrolase-1 domain-containing protein n=1 Tax=Oceanospirillum multiglobuliferum TaxID=64969 RepID=A0A1T4PIT4_9GAMM|nr:alpha/beta hydrolase [Oceanospirillum multiglobuliferum]OPX55527.1 hypothetical protein BTE48_07840 [Oceanospirillum multiglobuliferum]SJZ91409.1 Pimeloyl-ACP methyl ester carboxylesterase [Oceanospirillum multiglobuliferum]